MTRTPLAPSCRRQQGLATVEFAFVAIVLTTLTIGMAEFGRALYQYNTLSKSVREAARFLSVNALVITAPSLTQPSPQTMVDDATQYVLCGTNRGCLDAATRLPQWNAQIAAGDAAVTITEPTAGIFQVTASYAYQPLILGNTWAIGTNANLPMDFTLTASVTMRSVL